MSVTAQTIDPPSKTLLLLEGRALGELAAFVGALPLLSLAPRGDGHTVLVLPGLIASISRPGRCARSCAAAATTCTAGDRDATSDRVRASNAACSITSTSCAIAQGARSA